MRLFRTTHSRLMPHESRTNKSAIEHLARQDDFGHVTVNPLGTLQESQGYQRTTPERRRVYRNGSRHFLLYDDGFIDNETSTYVDDLNIGTLLEPDAGDEMTLRSTDRVSYAVGYNIVPTWAYEVNQLNAGDAIAAGYGAPDLEHFDPIAHEYYNSATADGWFAIQTGETGLGKVLLVQVRNGTIQDHVTERWQRAADIWKRVELWTSWYARGPGTLYETYTAVEEPPTPNRSHPQRTDLVSSVANDLGKGPLEGGKRLTFSVKQDTSNTGLELTCGSFSVLVPGDYERRFKAKGAELTLSPTNATEGTFEVVGAVQLERPRTTGRIQPVALLDYPSDTAEAEVLIQAIDPSETDLEDSDFARPNVHNRLNSAMAVVTDNTATGPDEGAAGTGATGPATSNTMTNPGGYQIGRTALHAEKKEQKSTSIDDPRRLPTTDYGLILMDATEAGDYVLDVPLAQNA